MAELVSATRAEGSAVSRPRRRRRLVVSAVAFGAVVLTAGGSLTAAQLNLPPFQTLEPGVQRIQQAIPVDYTTVTGKAVQCEAFLEFRNLADAQMDVARTYVAQRDWSGFGQQAYDLARRAAGSSSPDLVDRALGEVLDQRLTDAAEDAVPTASKAIDATGPAINGHSMACSTGQR